jgi:hypothetical protein
VIGAQVVTYQTSVPGSLDRKGIADPTYTETTLYGSLQPMEVKEDVTNIDYAIERFQFFTTPTATALAAKATDRLVDAYGTIYRVYGARVQPRINGSVAYVQIMLEIPSGLNG